MSSLPRCISCGALTEPDKLKKNSTSKDGTRCLCKGCNALATRGYKIRKYIEKGIAVFSCNKCDYMSIVARAKYCIRCGGKMEPY